MKSVKKVLSLILALMLLVSLAACNKGGSETEPTKATEAASKLPAYLQVNKAPLVTEDVTLRVAVLCDDVCTKPEDTWMYTYLKEVLGINVELESYYKSTLAENISLMMANGNLPDVMIGLGLNTVQLTRYGELEGLLLDLKPYLNEENAPNICALIDEQPLYIKSLTNDKGHVFSLGNYSERIDNTGCMRMYYNYDIMDAAGVEKVPTTLDEFVDMLRTIKKYSDDNNLGIVPFGGNYANYNPTCLILNALGYNYSTSSTTGCLENQIALRDGEVVLTCYDKEAFPKYLETMNTIYKEGLMEQDFYTQDKDTTKAHLSADKYAVFSAVPGLYGGAEFGSEWWGGIPLTSEYNKKPFWPNYGYTSTGAYVVSADTKYPELCVALADWFFNVENQKLVNFGPSVKQEDLFLGKTTGWYVNKDTMEYTYADYENTKDSYESILTYRQEKIGMWANLSFYVAYEEINCDEDGNSLAEDFTLPEKDIMEQAAHRKDYNNFNDQWQFAQQNTWGRYVTDEMSPIVCYFDQETTDRLADLKTLIDEYASQQIAKFIVGERPLSEVNDYFKELAGLGADEYVKIYADYFKAAK